jgi:thiol-disulfide isomerase/thioredoxin/tetratricopeptide (TPR) repeat protein
MLFVHRALLALIAVALLLPTVVEAKPRSRKGKEAARIDREVVLAMHLRDRGQVAEAIVSVQELIGEHPDAVAAHRLYQELAVLSRRNPRLIEAEYRHFLQQSPDDPLRRLLHASATLTSALVSPEMHTKEMLRELERKLAAAEADPGLAADAHWVQSDLDHFTLDIEGVEQHLRAGIEADPNHLAARADLVSFLSQKAQWAEATEACLDLIDRAPWRLVACSMLLRQAEDMPREAVLARQARGLEVEAPVELQNRLAERLEALEGEAADDPLTLQSLEWLYDFLGEKKGSRRLRQRLAELDPEWRAPLERSPYIKPTWEGELSDDERDFLTLMVETQDQIPDGDAWAWVRALQGLEPKVPEGGRIAAIYYRELSFALRAPDVLDRDASRAAIRQALDAAPNDPSIMNEWAYMSAVDEVDLVESLAAVERALELLLGQPFDPLVLDPGQSFTDWEIQRSETLGAFVDTRGWVLYRLGRHEEAVRDLYMASLLSSDGTVHGHLGRARFAVGDDRGAFPHLLRALALGSEDEEEVHDLARHLYEKFHVVPGGLDALVDEERRQISSDLDWAEGLLSGIPPDLDAGGGLAAPGHEGPPAVDQGTTGSRAGHPLLNTPAPSLVLTDLDGKRFDLAALKGQVVVIDFWATWCAPCVDAMPMMDALSRTFEAEGVVFLAPSMDDGIAEVRTFWGATDSPIKVGMAPRGGPEAFSVQGIPATFLIDQEGRIVWFHGGYDDRMAEQLTMRIIELLAAAP